MKRIAIAAFVAGISIAAAAAQEEAATRVYVMSEICTPELMSQNVYPQRAMERDMTGSGTIDCVLSEDHTPTTCQVVEESSPGWGWGEAAIRGSCRMDAQSWRRPRGRNAENYVDDAGVTHARRTVRFTLEAHNR